MNIEKKICWGDVMRLPLCSSVVAVGLLLVGCSSPNFYPTRGVELVGAQQEADIQKIRNVAAALNFELAKTVEPNRVTFLGRHEQVTLLEVWEWRTHRSTRIDIERGLSTNNFELGFADNQTHGFDLRGAPCTKYLEFVSAMKKAFSGGAVTLVFTGEGCADPGPK